MNIKHLFILPVMALGAVVSCSNGDTEGYTAKDMVISALPKTEIIVSEETTLSVANSELNKKVSWSTKSPEICSINNDGVVKGLKEGECELNAKYKSLASSFTVRVVPNSSILDITLSDEVVFLSREDSYVVTATAIYQDEPVEDVDFTWTSKNESVVKATADIDTSKATLVAIGEGEAEVLVSAIYKGVGAICGLTVTVNEHSISFNLTSADPKLVLTPVASGYDAEITGAESQPKFNCALYVDGEEVDESEIIWSSTDPNVCTVVYNDDSYYFDAVVAGNCVITGNYNNIGSVTLNVTVKESA